MAGAWIAKKIGGYMPVNSLGHAHSSRSNSTRAGEARRHTSDEAAVTDQTQDRTQCQSQLSEHPKISQDLSIPRAKHSSHGNNLPATEWQIKVCKKTLLG